MSFSMLDKIKNELNNNADFICREINNAYGTVFLFFLKSMTDKNEIAWQIIEPISKIKTEFNFNDLFKKILYASEVEEIKLEQCVECILQNKIVLFYQNRLLSIDLEKFPTRTPSEPPTSPNINGPREGFVESIKTNITLIRKRLPTPNLVIEDFVVGEETKSKVSVMYLKNIANKKVVKDITQKISKIKIKELLILITLLNFWKKGQNLCLNKLDIKKNQILWLPKC